VEYRVWAPDHRQVAVVIGHDSAHVRIFPLAADRDGYFAGTDPEGKAGDRYGYRLGDHPDRVPDVASRFQPEGVDGPSAVIDVESYRWSDSDWRKPPFAGRTIYELHVGTFSPEGTFRGAAALLPKVVELGVNTIELMPLADFPGRWNWGYDGVFPYAPARCYGHPDDLRALVDAAHRLGLAVIVDVVYNHLGPIGNYLPRYSSHYLHAERSSPWGQSFNFDGVNSEPVRNFFVQNAAYWIDEFHADGLRLDATHAVHDDSPQHLFAAVAEIAASRGAFTVAEDERNEAREISLQGQGAWKVNGVWADDFHHSVRVALTGDRHSYFAAYTDSTAELADILNHGWLYRGQKFLDRPEPRGTEARHLPAAAFVHCIDNHDQSGNRALGERLCQLTSPEAYRAAVVLLCLTPYTPMFFMGDEWAASSPFLFFTDHPGEIGEKMGLYRRQEFAAQGPEVLAKMPEPQAESTFRSSHLRWEERSGPSHAPVLALHQAALALRREHAHFQNPERSVWSASAQGERVELRWKVEGGDWLLLVSLKPSASGLPSEASAKEGGRARPGNWECVLSSEETRFGGSTTLPSDNTLRLAGPFAVLLRQR
jgi:maltooligosyltrehalose trehalohydrolase